MSLNYHRGGAGEPLVLIHGIGSRWQMWNPVLPLLEPERDVIAVDLPGFGASPVMPYGRDPGMPGLTQSVIELFDDLGLDRPDVAGNSLGGWLAFELAKAGRARTATGLSPAGFWTGPLETAFSRVSLFLARRTSRLALPYADWLTASPLRRKLAFSQLSGYPERIPAQDAALHLRGLGEAPGFEETLAAMINKRFQHGDQIDVPVTVAWGELDRLLSPRQALWAAHLIPQARSVVLYGCGHVPTYDDPAQVARVILQSSSS